MSLRSAASQKRINKLAAAIEAAGERLKGTTAPLISRVFVPAAYVVAKQDGHPALRPVYDLIDMPSWRISPNVGDKFFELKFMQAPAVILMPLVEVEGSPTPANSFALVDPEMVDVAYSVSEVHAIIELINNLQPYN